MAIKSKINYNNRSILIHPPIDYSDTTNIVPRDYYKGTSFRYSGEWLPGTHYVCDEYIIDFVVYNQVLLKCKHSHLSTLDNKPDTFVRNDNNLIIGIVSNEWDFVLTGVKGDEPIITADSAGNLYVDGELLTDILARYNYTKQDVIQDLDTIKSGAAAGATAYQLPEGGIPDTDLSQAVQQSLGKADSAVQWFIVTYNVTTMAEIKAAIEAGKLPMLVYNGQTIPLTKYSDITEEIGYPYYAAEFSTVIGTSYMGDTVRTYRCYYEDDRNLIEGWVTLTKQIPDAQIQSDWNQTTTTAKDYIKNKPDVVLRNEMSVTDNQDETVTITLKDGTSATVVSGLTSITDLIPQQATSSNQLADKAFVNSSISTATATFRGTYNLINNLVLPIDATNAQIGTALGSAISGEDSNDYAFVQIPTSASTPEEIARIDRYKYNGTDWVFEYSLNNSGFTAAQWAAINSGITSGLVTKLSALPTNEQLNNTLNGKENVISDLSTIRSGAAAGATAMQPFVAIYGTTSAKDIKDAIDAGKEPILTFPSDSTYAEFVGKFAGFRESSTFEVLNFDFIVVDGRFKKLYTFSVEGDDVIRPNFYNYWSTTIIDIPDAQVQSDWNQTSSSAKDFIKNKPDLSLKADKSEMDVSVSGDQTTITLKTGTSATVINQHQSLTPITELIPQQATANNQLADKDFVNSSISTATATYKGNYNLVSDLSLTTDATTSAIGTALASAISGEDNNDYAFVQIPTATATPNEIARIDRYKYDGTDWLYEYSLNNSGFTAAQWAAINSNITSALVTKLNGIAEGAEVNVIETITVNGVEQTVTNKTVAIVIPESVTEFTNAEIDTIWEAS